MATRLVETLRDAGYVWRYRRHVNFVYWRTRCEVEQKPETVAARRHIYQARQRQDGGELDAAKREYEQAWELWAKIIDENPELMQRLMADDLADDIRQYVVLLGQLEQKLPDDFKLRKLLEMHAEDPPAKAAPPPDAP